MLRALLALFGILLTVGTLADAASGETVVLTHKAREVTITLKSNRAQLTKGRNTFVLEFTAADNSPVDVGRVTFHTTMPMPGMAPMVADATLTREGPGRYRGTIEFPDPGTRQVTVSWDGPAGKGTARFSLPVR